MKCLAENPGADRIKSGAPGFYILMVLSTLMGFASISTDLYLPAMPAMALALHADAGMVELTISGYLIGFSLGQLFWGPVGDRYGRRPAVAVGLMLFVAGSAGCALSSDIWHMIGWRMVQALGACSSVALSRAMVRDIYQGNRAAQMLSVLLMVMAVAPLAGPIIGGQILLFSGWRAIFWLLVGIGILTFAALFTIPETLPPSRRSQIPLGQALMQYVSLLGNRRILGYAGAGGLYYAGMFAYVAGTPFVYITYYQIPAQYYGVLFGLGIVGIMSANFVNSRLIPRFGYDRLLLWGTMSAACSGVLVGICGKTGLGGLPGLGIPLFIFISSTGFIVANSIAGALDDFSDCSGAVSALIGAAQYGSGIVGSALVGAFADGTPWPLGWVIALSGIGSLLSMRLLKD